MDPDFKYWWTIGFGITVGVFSGVVLAVSFVSLVLAIREVLGT